MIWHGSDAAGVRSETGYCSAWRSSDPSESGSSSPIGRGLPLLDGCQNHSCSREMIVLCVENMSKYNVDRRLGKKHMHFDDK
ncbi:hypothetical protein AB6A40_008883 [Gnathostoma spinigerum]|uniref:Collagenase NC10/endostatin domain-containing protein n=1 Tax=Gnathostoma spinigerum TaxID=75299 RepID=A0ABD6EY43_9BILA